MANKILGQSIKRREDPELLTGQAKFVDDITLPNMLHMAILHSTEAHALIKGIDTSAAEQMPGVVKVITGADTRDLLPLPCIMNPGGEKSKFPPHPYGVPGAQTVLAIDKVRYVGEFVAVVVAQTRQQAYDALAGISVDYEPLLLVINAEQALKPDAPQLHDTVPGNLNQYNSYGDKDATAQAIANAEVVIEQKIHFPRLIHNPGEPRGSIGDYNPQMGEYTLWTNTQIPHGNRFMFSQFIMGIPYNKLRVIAPHIGEGFGSKGYLYPDAGIVLFLAKELGRPVKWIDTRKGLARSTVHGRNQIQYATIAGNKDGKITALQATIYANLGAYPATNGPGNPIALAGRSITGAYAIEHCFSEIYCAFTNTVPVGSFRGSGRAEATLLIERLVYLFAREIGMDPAEVKRKNLVGSDQFPYDNGLGWIYDSGNYQAALDRALEMIGYENIVQQKAAAKKQGKRLGVGIASYVGVSGVGPSPLMHSQMGMIGSTWGSVHLRVHPRGDVTLIVGSQPHGQGQVTTFSQIVAEVLGVDLERIEVLHSDTRGTIYAQGSYGSRTFSVEGTTIYKAAQKILDKARSYAAYLFKVAESEVGFEEGKFYVKNAPNLMRALDDVALDLWYAWDLPAGMEPGLEVIVFYDPPNFNYPFGTHVALVEVDEETGEVDVLRYVAVDDFGNVGNPKIVEAQTHGNIYLGISEALCEEAIYDDQGQILTDDYTTYATAKSSRLPPFETERTVTPNPNSPLGAKGCGDVANLPSPPALVNAVCDALRDLGVNHIDIPLTPEKVWRAIKNS
ncbi:MAG: xanthine dehydrogenase family protein molybdopterin-binding subunit [Microcystis aeruginosa SX13-11]|nr:xanthine dehydrogenase family protein molybdopterin-binding subunit [Microcystis aeruginosa SX13-11]